MINHFIAYDDNDSDLGDYFEGSHSNISIELSSNQLLTSVSIRGLDCTEIYINEVLSQMAGSRFIFTALSHGNENELVSHEVYVHSGNAHVFSNSLFYSCACSTGYGLGNNLIASGCLTFIGYFDTVFVIEDYHSVFYSCQNSGIKTFLSNDETIDTSFKKMIDYYTQEIDRLITGSMDDLVAASSLISNRDCLDMLGDRTVTRSDFNIDSSLGDSL